MSIGIYKKMDDASSETSITMLQHQESKLALFTIFDEVSAALTTIQLCALYLRVNLNGIWKSAQKEILVRIFLTVIEQFSLSKIFSVCLRRKKKLLARRSILRIILGRTTFQNTLLSVINISICKQILIQCSIF